MFWIDKKDIAHYFNSVDEICENDYKNNLVMIVTDPVNINQCNLKDKMFLVRGIGKIKPAISELVSAHSLKECEEKITQKYKKRLMEKSLLCVKYYEII